MWGQVTTFLSSVEKNIFKTKVNADSLDSHIAYSFNNPGSFLLHFSKGVSSPYVNITTEGEKPAGLKLQLVQSTVSWGDNHTSNTFLYVITRRCVYVVVLWLASPREDVGYYGQREGSELKWVTLFYFYLVFCVLTAAEDWKHVCVCGCCRLTSTPEIIPQPPTSFKFCRNERSCTTWNQRRPESSRKEQFTLCTCTEMITHIWPHTLWKLWLGKTYKYSTFLQMQKQKDFLFLYSTGKNYTYLYICI